MNAVVVCGALSGVPRHHLLASGGTLVAFDVVTDVHGGRVSVPVAWFDPPATSHPLEDGDEVVLVGSVQRRFFRSAGITQTRTDVVATQVVLARRRSQARRLFAGWLDGVAAEVAGRAAPADQPLPSSANDSRKRSTKLTSPARSQTRGS